MNLIKTCVMYKCVCFYIHSDGNIYKNGLFTQIGHVLLDTPLSNPSYGVYLGLVTGRVALGR